MKRCHLLVSTANFDFYEVKKNISFFYKLKEYILHGINLPPNVFIWSIFKKPYKNKLKRKNNIILSFSHGCDPNRLPKFSLPITMIGYPTETPNCFLVWEGEKFTQETKKRSFPDHFKLIEVYLWKSSTIQQCLLPNRNPFNHDKRLRTVGCIILAHLALISTQAAAAAAVS